MFRLVSYEEDSELTKYLSSIASNTIYEELCEWVRSPKDLMEVYSLYFCVMPAGIRNADFFEGIAGHLQLDESGKEIISFAPSKTFQNIIMSSPDINSGVTYTFYTGGTSSSENKYGLYSNGGYNNDGTESASFTADSAVSAIGSQGMGGGMNGGMGGHGGRMGGGFGGERPEMPEGGFNDEMPF